VNDQKPDRLEGYDRPSGPPMTAKEALRHDTFGSSALAGVPDRFGETLREVVDSRTLLLDVPIAKIGRYGDLSFSLLSNAITLKGTGGIEINETGLEKIRCAWRNSTRAPFVKGIIGPLVDVIKERMRVCKEAGHSYLDVTNDLSLSVEIICMLLQGDINGYSQISTESEVHQKASVSADYYTGLGGIGGNIAEQIQGDAALSMIPGGLSEGLSAMKRYDDLDIAITDPDLIALIRPETEQPYFPKVSEGRHRVTFSLGMKQGKVTVDLRTGKAGERGLIRAHGADYKEVVDLQSAAKPGESLLDSKLIDKARLLGVNVTDSGKVLSIPDHLNQAPDRDEDLTFPEDDLILAVKVVEALCKLFPNLGSIDALTKEEGVELTSELNCTYMVVKFKSPEGKDVTELNPFWNALASQGTGSKSVGYFKVVGDTVHCTARIEDKEDWKGSLTPFFKQMHKIAQSFGLEAHISVAYEDALEILPVPNSAYVDYTGEAIVASYRGASLRREGSWISLDRSFLKYTGLMTNEMSTFGAKGLSYQHVFWDIEEDGKIVPHETELVGVSHIETAIQDFLQVEDPRKVFQLLPPNGYEGTGSGVSALQRRSVQIAIDECGVSSDRIRSIHGTQGSPRELVASILGCKPAELGRAMKSLSDPVLIIKEGPTSVQQQEELDWLARTAYAAQVPLKQMVDGTVDTSDTFYNGEVLERQSLRELTIAEALGMIFEARADLDPATDTRILRSLIRSWVNHREGRWLVPRYILNELAVQLVKDGDTVSLPEAKERRDWMGELARELESKKVSQRGRTIVGILALVGEPLTAEELTTVYSQAYRAVPLSEIKEELKVLGLSGEQPFIVCEGAKCRLGPWDRKLGMMLARKGETQIRKWAIERNLVYQVSDANLNTAEREFEHRTKVREFCVLPRTFELVADLIEHYGREKKNVVAAMTVARRYLQATQRYAQVLNPCPANKRLLMKMSWVIMQVGTPEEKKTISAYLTSMQLKGAVMELSEDERIELNWRSIYSLTLNQDLPKKKPVDPQHASLKDAFAEYSKICDRAAGVCSAVDQSMDALVKWNLLNVARQRMTEIPEASVLNHGLDVAMAYQLAWAMGRMKLILRRLPDAPVEIKAVLQTQVSEFQILVDEILNRPILADVQSPIAAEINVNSWRLLAGIRGVVHGNSDEMLHNLFNWALRGYAEIPYPVESQRFDAENGAMNARVMRVYGWLKATDPADKVGAEKVKHELLDLKGSLDKIIDRLIHMAHHQQLAKVFMHLRNTYELFYTYYKKFEPENITDIDASIDNYVNLDNEMFRLCNAIGKDYERDESFYDSIYPELPTEEIPTEEL